MGTFHEIESWHKRLAGIDKLKSIYSKDVKFNCLVNLLVDSGLSKKEIRQAVDLATFFKDYDKVEKNRVYLSQQDSPLLKVVIEQNDKELAALRCVINNIARHVRKIAP